MKKLLSLVAIATLLLSCDTTEKVKLSNGAYISVKNNTDINYTDFDAVCVQRSKEGWSVCSDGEMRDTTIVLASGSVTHRIGRIVNHYR
jgi:hypothetical protein